MAKLDVERRAHGVTDSVGPYADKCDHVDDKTTQMLRSRVGHVIYADTLGRVLP